MKYIKRQLKRFLLSIFYRKLWVKIACLLILVVTIPMALLGILLIHTSQKAMKNSVLNNHKEIVTRAAKEMELFVKNPEKVLATAAAMLGAARFDAWKQETILVELILNQPIFLRASSIDLAGKEIATSELGKELTSGSYHDILPQIKNGNKYMSDITIVDNHTPYMTIAVPVKRMGKIAGAIVADINLRGIWDIIDNIKLDRTGRAFLVSREGIVLAHQDKKKVLKNENLKAQKDVSLVLAGNTGAIELEDTSGKDFIGSFSPIPDLGWGIVLRQEQDEAYLFSGLMKMQSWIIIILSEIIVIFISIFIAKVLARPIKTLAGKMQMVAAGNLDNKIDVIRRDEFGELIRSFNDMIEKLKKARVRERLSAIGETTSRIAHEFKNSLVPLKLFMQLFPKRHNEKEFIYKFNKMVPEEIEHCDRIIKELSSFSSHSELKLVVTDIRNILDNLLDIMEEQFVSNKIKVHYTAPGDNFRITADPEKLKEVFMNLIINAINAMPKGGLLDISIKQIKNEYIKNVTHIEVKIKDTGKGIPKDKLKSIFELFYTTKKGHMGLGLSITRSIVEQHGGSITVESEVDVGTTFTVKLPVKVYITELEQITMS